MTLEILFISFFLFTLISLFRPIVGLYLLLFISYVRPQDYYPAFAAIRPALILLIVISISFIVYQNRKKNWVNAPQNRAILGLLICILLSGVKAIDYASWSAALEEFTRITLAYFMIINLVDTPKKLKTFYLIFILVNLIVCIRFYYAYKFGTVTIHGSKPGGSSHGFLANADDLGIGMAFALGFVIVPILYTKNLFTKGLACISSGLFLLAVLGTRSRGASIGVITSVVTTMITQIRIRKFKLKGFGIGALIILVMFTGFLYKYRYTLKGFAHSSSEKEDSGRIGREATWGAAIKMIKSNPILGVGRGNYIAYWKSHYPAGVYGYQVQHNIILQVTSELGIIGLILFLWFSLHGLKDIRLFRKFHPELLERNNQINMIFAIYIVCLVTFFVNGMFITVAFYWHIYMLVAMLVAAKSILNRQYETESPEKGETVY